MKKSNILPILTIAVLLMTGLFWTAPVQAAKPELNKSSVNLHIEQGYSLKIKGLDKKLTVKWSVRNKKIATVSLKGVVKGQTKGKTVIYAKIYNKNKLKYTLKANVKVDNKGYATTQALLVALLKNKKVNDIIVHGKAKFTIPKGNFGKNLESAGEDLSLKVSEGSSLNSVIITGSKAVKIDVAGQLSYLYVRKDNAKISLKSSGKKAIVHTVFLENPAKLDFVSDSKKEPSNIYVLAKSDIKISGKSKKKDVVAIGDSAEETRVTANKSITVFADARTTLVVNSGAKDSKITTLDYKTPITVTNNTGTSLFVSTPSGKKTVEAGKTHTVTGKN